MLPAKLEKAILDWISSRQPSLATRLATAEIARREHTGAGFYVYLSHQADTKWDRLPVDGPNIESSQLEFGAGSMLWLSHGEPCCLEIYSYGNHFPEHLDEFKLSSSD
jgi:hypothetical protein